MRHADEAQGFILKRFISAFCAELDNYDQLFDTFFQNINPDTASEHFIEFWLWSLFGWGWFPDWFTLPRKRAFYRDIAKHYARRGTARGITEFLAVFGIHSRVIVQPQYWGEMTLGEAAWTMDGPLAIIVQIFPKREGVAEEASYFGEWTLGEDVIAQPAFVIEKPDVDALLRFQQPAGHFIIIEEKIA
jgi:phage tail-like protein